MEREEGSSRLLPPIGCLRVTDPKMAKAYTIKAAEMGHETAQFMVKEEGWRLIDLAETCD